MLDLPEDDLVVAPAMGPVRDFAHAGFPARQVMVAVQRELEGDVPFVLDQRPLLLGMQWAFARNGRVNVQDLCLRHQRRCPPGHFLRVIGGYAAGDLGNHYRYVYPGQLIVVTYRPFRSSPDAWYPDEDDHPPPDDRSDRPPDAGEVPRDRSALPVLCLDNLVAPPAHASPQQLSDPPVFDLDNRQCLLPGSSSRIGELLHHAAVASFQGVPELVHIPPVCRAWIKAGCVGRSPTPHELLVLTSDGSFTSSSQSVGWGIVCSLANNLETLPGQFVGCLFGDMHSLFAEGIAADVCKDAYTAEVSGLVGCALLALQLRVCCPIVIRADNVSALEGTRGASQMRNDVICQAARCLHAAAAQHTSGPLQYSHVPGHSGEVANELADALAKYGASGRQALSPLCFPRFSTPDDIAMLRWLPHVCLTAARSNEMLSVNGKLTLRMSLVIFSIRPEWTVDASEHAALLVDHLYRGLSTAFPVQRKRMRVGYLSEQSEAIHRVVASLRHSLRNRKAAHRLTFIRCAWLAWQSGTESFHAFFCGKWLLQLEVRIGLDCMLMRRYGVALRRSCREDRNQMYARLAAEVADAPLAEMHHAVKRVLRPRKFRKAGVEPLPTLYKADGSQCMSETEITTTWREHFRVLEGADQIDAAELPTWLDLEAFHRSLRGLLVRHWSRSALPLQIGGRAGCSAFFGSLCSRAMLAYARAQGLSAGLIFIDLSSAYYAVIRETLFGKGLSDRPVEEIAAALNLSTDDLQELTRLIEQDAVLPQQGASDFMQEIAREFHQQTWFILSGDSQMIATHRGTRPGGTLADILFSLLFGQALRRRKSSSLRVAVPQIQWQGVRTPFPAACAPDTPSKDVSDVVYADDLCIPVVCAEASQLRHTVSAVAADTFDTLAPRALRVNFGPTKTAAIVSPVGHGSRQARQEMFGTLRGRVPIWAESRGMQWLDLVARYRHLGSVLLYDGTMTADVKHRLALARTAFRDGKRRLFACKDIPLQKRAVLFRGHVLSTLLAGVGSWPRLGICDWKIFSRGVFSLYRQLLGLRADGKWNYTADQLLAMTGLPSPQCLLHVERLRLLSQMVRSGPDEIWALVGQFEPYKEALRDAGAWLLSAVGTTVCLGTIEQDWPSWSTFMSQSPGKWKGVLKRAEAWYDEATRLRAEFDTVVRSVWQPHAALSTLPRVVLEPMFRLGLMVTFKLPLYADGGKHTSLPRNQKHELSYASRGSEDREVEDDFSPLLLPTIAGYRSGDLQHALSSRLHWISLPHLSRTSSGNPGTVRMGP
ncbi:hypothetical protein AK812_SmicGene22279 [Symbiodinium microadriaticum]|uniref:Uncharacterized protein n=1 Tax=Symbiodinium microadriaticum TaxID=2951 RepID=A0A1Q9DK87_SYMMI|nr:hypothetical protein AK812_SmicGene22279 [Symbiodinium microadriaticum]